MINNQRKSARIYSPGEKQRDRTEAHGRHDIVLCPDCSSVYYQKAWHHSLSNHTKLTEDHHAKIGRCPACQMWREHEWEGELRISNVPREHVEELSHLIYHVSEYAFDKDPMHRVFAITPTKNLITVLTSENQLPVRIAKKLHDAHKSHFAKPLIHKRRGDDPILVTMEWK